LTQETRHILALDVNSGVTWNNEPYAKVEDDNYADSSDIGDAEYGGGNYQDITNAPDTLDLFQVRFFDINSEHSDDSYPLEIYNPHTSAWEILETFSSANKLPTSLTTKDYTLIMIAKFNAAIDKVAFLNGLQIRFRCSKSKGADNVNIGLAWSKFVYTYTEGNIVQVSGVINGQSGVAGSSKVGRKASGSIGAGSGIMAAPKVSRSVSGAVACQTDTVGICKALKKISGITNGQSGMEGGCKRIKSVAGIINGVSNTPDAAPHVTRNAIGLIDGQSDIPGIIIHVTKKAVGSIYGQSNIPDVITHVTRNANGIINGDASLTGSVKVNRQITGIINGITNLGVVPKRFIKITGQSGAQSVLSATIKVNRKISGNITSVSSLPSAAIHTLRKISGIIECESNVYGTATVISEGGIVRFKFKTPTPIWMHGM
jgi:hypothetical protein